jgi:hypothetical protein
MQLGVRLEFISTCLTGWDERVVWWKWFFCVAPPTDPPAGYTAPHTPRNQLTQGAANSTRFYRTARQTSYKKHQIVTGISPHQRVHFSFFGRRFDAVWSALLTYRQCLSCTQQFILKPGIVTHPKGEANSLIRLELQCFLKLNRSFICLGTTSVFTNKYYK